MNFMPRPAQERILEYTGGPMGVSAVPGSGKTFTLSLLAARLVARLAEQGTADEKEVLVVTFTNSAVENFRARIGGFIREAGLLANVGYRVRTLHGLAHDIVRERPALAGLSESFDIIEDRVAAEIKRESAIAYLRANPDTLAPYIKPEYLQNFNRIARYVEDDVVEIANAVIRTAKEERAEPAHLSGRRRNQSGTWPLLDFGIHVYADYQRSLLLRGAVDFDDLILLALRALDADPDFLARLQNRWPYILEDEAQDSSSLQEEMLRRLTASHGNWVRVGDPNQAINTTFTSARAHYLSDFIRQHEDESRQLPNSGRCARPIIDLANHLIRWSQRSHPTLSRTALPNGRLSLDDPLILPTEEGDPQPNPEPGTPPVYLYDRPLNSNKELEVILASLRRWLPDNPDRTVAVLTPDNFRGFRFTEALKAAQIPYDDSLLRTSNRQRETAEALTILLRFLGEPQNPARIEAIWSEVWWRWRYPFIAPRIMGEDSIAPVTIPFGRGSLELPEPLPTIGMALRRIQEPELFLFPGNRDWAAAFPGGFDEWHELRPYMQEFRADLQRWVSGVILPVDELVLTLGNDLFTEPADLAISYHLATRLAKVVRENPMMSWIEIAEALSTIASQSRLAPGFEDDTGYEPKKGCVTLATMHGAKGLEWDRVYLTSVNDYSFPVGMEGERYRSERWYVRDSLNLVAETIAQVRQLRMGTLDDYTPGDATRQARLDLAAERLRLLYVGITRARRELIITYNTGRENDRTPNAPALAFEALRTFWDERSRVYTA